jgi:hypothetical protein
VPTRHKEHGAWTRRVRKGMGKRSGRHRGSRGSFPGASPRLLPHLNRTYPRRGPGVHPAETPVNIPESGAVTLGRCLPSPRPHSRVSLRKVTDLAKYQDGPTVSEPRSVRVSHISVIHAVTCVYTIDAPRRPCDSSLRSRPCLLP